MAGKSMKTKFVLVTCLICLLSLILVSTVSYWISLQLTKQQLNQKISAQVAGNANLINEWFKQQENSLDEIRGDIIYHRVYDDPNLNSYLYYKLSRQPQVLDYYIGFTDGRFTNGTYWDPPTNYDHTTREWYKAALQKQGIVYIAPYVDAMSGKMVITIAEPINSQGKTIGVIAADITIDKLVSLIDETRIEKKGYAYLLDQENHFLVHPAAEAQPASSGLKDARRVFDGLYSPIISKVHSTRVYTTKIRDYDKVSRSFFITQIPNSGWVYGQAINWSEYTRPLNYLLCGFVLTLVISMVIGIFIILSAINGLIRPIKQLGSAVKRFAHSDFAARSAVDTDDEIGDLSRSFNDMAAVIQEYNIHLESMVEQRTVELQESNARIMESMNYAKRLQEAILPDFKPYQGTVFSDHFIIWRPRDIVGGDFYWAKSMGDNYYLALIDCTGHGVPGALMTMMVNAMLDRITADDMIKSPAMVLQELNQIIKTTLHQDIKEAITNDGVDIGLCLLQPHKKQIIFAGAKISLFAVRDDGINQIKGDRQSIGYKKSRLDYEYHDNMVELSAGQTYYMTTDGFLDQNGADDCKRFGQARWLDVLAELKGYSLANQQEKLLRLLNQYMGSEMQRDDITILGFKI